MISDGRYAVVLPHQGRWMAALVGIVCSKAMFAWMPSTPIKATPKHFRSLAAALFTTSAQPHDLIVRRDKDPGVYPDFDLTPLRC